MELQHLQLSWAVRSGMTPNSTNYSDIHEIESIYVRLTFLGVEQSILWTDYTRAEIWYCEHRNYFCFHPC